MNNIGRRIVFLFVRQFINRSIPINVGNKPESGRAFCLKLIFSAVIQNNSKAVYD